MKADVEVRAMYGYDRDAVSDATGLACEDESLTVQSEKEETDINTIVRRFGIVGVAQAFPVMPTQSMFMDVMDFQSAMNVIREAEERFMEVPAELRARFENSPQKFLDFTSDPANLPELVKMGLAVEKEDAEGKEEGGAPAPRANAASRRGNVGQGKRVGAGAADRAAGSEAASGAEGDDESAPGR